MTMFTATDYHLEFAFLSRQISIDVQKFVVNIQKFVVICSFFYKIKKLLYGKLEIEIYFP